VWHQTVEELRKHYPKVGVGHLCGLFGKTRHAFYDKKWHKAKRSIQEELVLEMVYMIRNEMPKLGGYKIYLMLVPFVKQHKIKMGRDAIFDLLRANGLVLKRKKKYVRTTYSNHRFKKYPNLITNFEANESEQLCVCDITYIELEDGYNYLSLITDDYSKKVLGYCLYETLEAQGCINALNMALSTRKKKNKLIHHSDRGIQYCCDAYVKILNEKSISISMTQNGSPYDNAVAERLNGILKTEFGLDKVFKDHKQALNAVNKSISVYNAKRPHASCDYYTPNQAHYMKGKFKKKWKKYQKTYKSLENQEKLSA